VANLLIVDDEHAITSVLGTFFERGGHRVTRAHTGQEGIDRFLEERPDLILLDLRLPDMTGFDVLSRLHEYDPMVVMITAHGDVPLAVEAMKKGAENFLTKPVELDHLAIVVDRALEKARLRNMNRYLVERRGNAASKVLLGSSRAMRDLAEQVELLASSDKTTGLIVGESGTGKGRVAELIHSLSPRASQPFVEVNCASLTVSSLDSELFGVERTLGAEPRDARPGLLEVAKGGTVFLDEIGDLDPLLQPKLLRVLEGRSFRRVGGTQEISTNVRVIASTSKDLVNEIISGRFREDLYYRLSVMPVHLPPLRSRAREDLLELIANVLDGLHPQLPESPDQLSDAALDRLLKYPWPGNIRELRNVLERALIVARGAGKIGLEHLPNEVRDTPGGQTDNYVPKTLEEMERAHIDRTLRANNRNRTHAAKELGISRATLIKKIKQYGLSAQSET
jgi:two-component system, NtrC family, response regulator AtoC